MESFDEVYQNVRMQCKNGELKNPFGWKKMSLKDWSVVNREFIKQLKDANVKFRTAFYNPNDENVYIKQSFRNVKVDGLVQWTCSYEDVLFLVLGGNEEPLKKYHLDDLYFSVPSAHFYLANLYQFDDDFEEEEEDNMENHYKSELKECKDVDDFIFKIDCEIDEIYERMDNADENMEAKYEEIINTLRTSNLYNGGVMSYEDLVAFRKSYEKKTGEKCEIVFNCLKMTKDNLEALKTMVWDEGLGYSDAHFEEEKIREEKMTEGYEKIENITGFKKWLKEFDVCGYYGFFIWKNHLVSTL